MPRGPAHTPLEELLAQSTWLRRLASTLVAGEAAAEDLVQETWLAALRHPPGDPGSARPWLARIARNLAANFRRGEARRKEREAGARGPDPELDPGTVVEEVEAQRALAEAVLRLEEPLRTAVVLRYLRGLDSRAIGRVQGVPAGTVRWRLKRGLELLRADLDRRFGGRRSWCSAFAVLLPEGAAASVTTGASLAETTIKLGATAALAASSLLVLFGASWFVARDEARPKASLTSAALDGPRDADAEEVELVQPVRLDELSGRARSLRGRTLPADRPATSSAGSRRRAPIRGQLRIAGSEDALDETLTMRLRSGDMSAKETVQTAPDGSFRSKRPFPRGFVLADVQRPGGDPVLECEAFFDPSSEEEWNLPVPWPNFVRCRLVDRAGRPLTGVDFHLQQGGNESEPSALDNERFSFTGLDLGPCRLTVRRGFERHEFTTTVARGPNELGDVVVPFREGGPISGRLRSKQGDSWGELRLTEVASGVTYRDNASPEFEFEGIPLAEYRLTLLPYDGLLYQAPTRVVHPPMTDIEFMAIGESVPIVVRARAGDNELVGTPGDNPILLTDRDASFSVEAQAWTLVSGHWCPILVGCEPTDVERWILVADGYRPVAGRSLDSTRIDARLEPGWGCALFFREGSGGNYEQEKGPIAGVEVRADGVLVARSDPDGVALISLPHPPEKLECGLAGWVGWDHPDGELPLDGSLESVLRLVRE